MLRKKCACRFKLFWTSAWNIFDFFIVLASLLILHPASANVPVLGSLGLLKPLRVFRLFKRVRQIPASFSLPHCPCLHADNLESIIVAAVVWQGRWGW